jgi:drug/metabolite transporter (DMT)-like permease
MLLGVMVGGETITSYEWVAAGIVLAGVLLLIARPAR